MLRLPCMGKQTIITRSGRKSPARERGARWVNHQRGAQLNRGQRNANLNLERANPEHAAGQVPRHLRGAFLRRVEPPSANPGTARDIGRRCWRRAGAGSRRLEAGLPRTACWESRRRAKLARAGVRQTLEFFEV
jgi:hypothetical protein